MYSEVHIIVRLSVYTDTRFDTAHFQALSSVKKSHSCRHTHASHHVSNHLQWWICCDCSLTIPCSYTSPEERKKGGKNAVNCDIDHSASKTKLDFLYSKPISNPVQNSDLLWNTVSQNPWSRNRMNDNRWITVVIFFRIKRSGEREWMSLK